MQAGKSIMHADNIYFELINVQPCSDRGFFGWVGGGGGGVPGT